MSGTRPEQESPDRRPLGTGEDGAYVHNRKPTVDDIDDVDDEDGAQEDEVEMGINADIEPRVENPRDRLADVGDRAELGEGGDLGREDKGAVNIEPDDLRR
jgi:hypothetical protein